MQLKGQDQGPRERRIVLEKMINIKKILERRSLQARDLFKKE